MEISNYIKELLLLDECVILPGFGGFISKYKPAEIDNAQSCFIPPSKEIVFNSNLIHNDGLLINYTAIVNRISYKEAKGIISDFICKIYTELEKNNTVYFGEIGSFKYDPKGNILFEAEHSSNLLIDSYGLPTFHFPVIEEMDVPHTIEKKFKDRGGIRTIFRHPVTKGVLIGIPVIAAFAVITLKTDLLPGLREKYHTLNNVITDTIKNYNKLYNPISEEATLIYKTNKRNALYYHEPAKTREKMEQPVKTVTTSADTISAKPVIITTGENKNTPQEISNNRTTEQPNNRTVSASHDKYYLVAGSFGNHNNAKAFSSRFSSKGYSAEILQQEKGLYRVALKSFTDRDSAAKELALINSKNTDFTVWILQPK